MKKKILFINGHLNAGGVEKSLVDVLKNLDTSKYEIDLLLLEELGDYGPELPAHIRVNLRNLKNTYGAFIPCLLRCMREKDWFSFRMRLILTMRKVFGVRCIRLAKKMLTDGEHYDCAIGFRSGVCSEIAAFAVNAKKRIIWWHHGEMNVNSAEYETVASVCDQVVTVSDACCDMLGRAIPSVAKKIVVIPNMLDEKEIRSKAQLYHPYPDKHCTRIVTVGRLSPEKHIENVIEAAFILKRKGYRFSWHIVGDGMLLEELKDLSKQRQVTECVHFEGNRSNPYPYIRHADLMVHPSYVESQGLAILEAMVMGVPCVVTRSHGPCEYIIDGENGLLTEQNAQSLAEQVERMLSDPKLYERIKRKTVCPEKYCVESVREALDGTIQ